MIKTAQEAYLAGRQAAMEKLAESDQYMRDWQRANLDAGHSGIDNAVLGAMMAGSGGYLASLSGGSTKSKLIRGALGALPGIGLGVLAERKRRKNYEDLENMSHDELAETYNHNKKVLDDLGIPHGHFVNMAKDS